MVSCVLCNRKIIEREYMGLGARHFCPNCRILYDAKMEGIYIGRFQPFHNGHLALVKEALKEVKLLHIVVGSAQHKYTKENPFSADERTEMIKLALRAEGITNFDVTPVPDVMWHDQYFEHIKSFVPNFSIAFFADNKRLEQLFLSNGCKTKCFPRVGNWSATEIRDKIANKGEWEFIVPQAVQEYLNRIGGIERIKDLS